MGFILDEVDGNIVLFLTPEEGFKAKISEDGVYLSGPKEAWEGIGRMIVDVFEEAET
jgi:hypothetical protein